MKEKKRNWQKNAVEKVCPSEDSVSLYEMDQPFDYESNYRLIFTTKKTAARMTSWKTTSDWNTNLCILFSLAVFRLINVHGENKYR